MKVPKKKRKFIKYMFMNEYISSPFSPMLYKQVKLWYNKPPTGVPGKKSPEHDKIQQGMSKMCKEFFLSLKHESDDKKSLFIMGYKHT